MFTFVPWPFQPRPLPSAPPHTHTHIHLFPPLVSSPLTGIGFITVVNPGPGGQLFCSTVHLNIILLIKGLPAPHYPHHHHHHRRHSPRRSHRHRSCPLLARRRPFVHPATHPLAPCQAMLLLFEKRRRHLCLRSPLSRGLNLRRNIGEFTRTCVCGRCVYLTGAAVHSAQGSSGLNQPWKKKKEKKKSLIAPDWLLIRGQRLRWHLG